MILTKSWIIGLVLGISIILITTPFQASTNHFKKDSIFSPSSNDANFVFAQTAGEVNGDTESQLPEEPPAEEPPAEEPPAEEPPAEEPPAEEPPAEEPPAEPPNGNNTPPSPSSPPSPPLGNNTPPQELPKVENASQAISGVADKDKELENYLDKTRDERVDRHICVHSPYYGEWNYDTNECKIDNPDLKQEYEKEQKENLRFDKLICPRYGGEWNDKEKKCQIEDLEERTAYEDYLCDDPADTILYCDPSFA